MRFAFVVAVASSVCAGSAFADIAVPAPACDVAFPPAPSPPPPPDDEGQFFGNVFFTAPPLGTSQAVPRNVQVRLGGSTSDVGRGFFDIASDAGAVHVVDADVLPDAGLWPANTTVTVTLTPSPTNPCQGCFGQQQITFVTNDVVDDEAPALDVDGVVANGFVLPSIAEQQQCGQFGGNTHTLEVTVPTVEPLFLTVGGRSARNAPTLLLRDGFVSSTQPLSLSFGNTVVLTLGEAVVLVLTARDLAGNVSPPIALRVRMRSFKDRVTTEIAPLTCALSPRPEVEVPGRLPRNPSLRVLFPFEELPLALRPVNGGDDVPLVPTADVVDDARGGHVFQTSAPVDAGEYDVVGLACPHCLCASCNALPRQRVVLDDVVDEVAPAGPVVTAIIDDPAPATAVGACHPDDAATLVVLAPAEDDVSGPADLLYDVVVRVDGGLPRPAATALPALRRADGDVVVRVPTAEFGRLAGSDFELTLTARDVGGHTSRGSYTSKEDEEAGCGGGGSAAGVVGVVLVALRRRARR